MDLAPRNAASVVTHSCASFFVTTETETQHSYDIEELRQKLVDTEGQ